MVLHRRQRDFLIDYSKKRNEEIKPQYVPTGSGVGYRRAALPRGGKLYPFRSAGQGPGSIFFRAWPYR